MQTVFWDLETRSAVNLRDCGAAHLCDRSDDAAAVSGLRDRRRRAAALVAARSGAGGLPRDRRQPGRLAAGRAQLRIRARDPRQHSGCRDTASGRFRLHSQHCTQRLALANAYPAELDLLAQALGLPYRKDPAARKAMLAVSRPKAQRKRKATTVPTWDEDPAKLQLLYERCKLDVITTRAVWQSPKLKHLSATERHYQIQDAIINARGVRCDRAFVTAARDLAIRERTAINLKLQELTHGTITSVDQTKRFLAAINARGHTMTTLNKRAVAAGAGAQARRLCAPTARAAPHRRPRRGQQVQAHAGLRLAARRPHARHLAHVWRRSRTLGRARAAAAELEKEREQSAAQRRRFHSRRRSQRHCPVRQSAGAARRYLARRALRQPGHGAQIRRLLRRRIASCWLGSPANDGSSSLIETYQHTGDTTLEPYRVIARKMLQKPADAEINTAERQLGKGGELAAGFGGSVGAWRRIMPHDPRSDDEIKAIIKQWRDAHPAIRKFWNDLARAIRVAIRTGQPILVAPAPQPPIVAAFADGNLTLTLPSGRAITYPEARLVPAKFEDAPPDVQFMDNARGQWKPYRGWFGTFVENVVQGTARDLLAAAIERFETRGIDVVFHCHDEVTVEVPIGSLSDAEFLRYPAEAARAGRPDCRSAAKCIRDRIIWRRRSRRPNHWSRRIPTTW